MRGDSSSTLLILPDIQASPAKKKKKDKCSKDVQWKLCIITLYFFQNKKGVKNAPVRVECASKRSAYDSGTLESCIHMRITTSQSEKNARLQHRAIMVTLLDLAALKEIFFRPFFSFDLSFSLFFTKKPRTQKKKKRFDLFFFFFKPIKLFFFYIIKKKI